MVRKTIEIMEDFLEEFIEWAEHCGEDAFYIFDKKKEAIKRFMSEREE